MDRNLHRRSTLPACRRASHRHDTWSVEKLSADFWKLWSNCSESWTGSSFSSLGSVAVGSSGLFSDCSVDSKDKEAIFTLTFFFFFFLQ